MIAVSCFQGTGRCAKIAFSPLLRGASSDARAKSFFSSDSGGGYFKNPRHALLRQKSVGLLRRKVQIKRRNKSGCVFSKLSGLSASPAKMAGSRFSRYYSIAVAFQERPAKNDELKVKDCYLLFGGFEFLFIFARI